MLGFGVRAKALSKLDPMALFYSGTLAPIYTGIDTVHHYLTKSSFLFIIASTALKNSSGVEG